MEYLTTLSSEWKTAIIILIIIVLAAILTKGIRWLINTTLVTSADKLKIEPTRYKFFKNAASFIIWLIALGAIVSLIPKLKTLAITLFAGAGILVAIIGFAAQQAFSNIINGIFIVIFKPFRVGDIIKVGTLDYGIVEDITLRHTVIKNFENKRIIIPNSVVGSETIVNDSIEDSKICRWIEVGISYDSSIDLAIKIIQEEALKHPACIDARTQQQIDKDDSQVAVRVLGFGDFSVNLRAYVWASDSSAAFRMHSDLNKVIKERFDREGIEIPFPYRTLVYKKDMSKNTKTPKE